jgi:hypothetical protein
MLLFNNFKPQFAINKNLHEYCKKYTEELIKKRVEHYNLEKNKNKFYYLLDQDNNNKPTPNYFLLFILSIATFSFSYYNYKRLC